jgi:hypothetical protein
MFLLPVCCSEPKLSFRQMTDFLKACSAALFVGKTP